jgi:hypothetical protein
MESNNYAYLALITHYDLNVILIRSLPASRVYKRLTVGTQVAYIYDICVIGLRSSQTLCKPFECSPVPIPYPHQSNG